MILPVTMLLLMTVSSAGIYSYSRRIVGGEFLSLHEALADDLAAADWGHVSADTDWNFNDYEVERLAEIMSRHAPYETDDLWSDYTKNIKKFPRHSVQEALSRGYRMGARLRQRGCNLCG